MILKLRLSNFYSIAEEITLDFTAEGKKSGKESSHLLDFNGDKFVSIIGLFGSNAAGKSNLIKAVAFCRNLILTSANNTEDTIFDYEPFKFETDKSSEFNLNFEWEGVEYDYSFEIFKGIILSESLYYYPRKRRTKVFHRENTTEYSYGKGQLSRPAEIETSTGHKTLFLSRGSSMNRPLLQSVYRFFKDGIWIEKSDYGIENKIRLLIDNHKPILLKALSVGDSDIVDIAVTEISPGIPVLHTFHRENPKIPFDFTREESEGTKRLFHILLMLIERAQSDTTIFFDEFDLKLHLKLSEFILDLVSMFGKAQLVFTSHNPSLLNRDRFRNEQIVFVTKLPNGSSEFVPLCDYEGVTKIKDLQKAYLQGRFDGVPYLGNLSEINTIE